MDQSSSNLNINKINRLLRVLKSSLNALTQEMDLSISRSNTILSQPSNLINNKKGKNKALDQDNYGESPFKKKKVQVKSTYGSKNSSNKGLVGDAIQRSFKFDPNDLGTGSNSKSVGNEKERLLSGGLSKESANKALLVLKAYKNVLETIHGINSTTNRQGTKLSSVPSLVETVSNEVGWNIEVAVRNSIEEAEAVRNGSSDDEVEQGLIGKGYTESRSRRSANEEEEEEQKLVEEYYEVAPFYCRKWIFAQHATFIVIDALQNYSTIILLLLLEMCIEVGADSEACRYFVPLSYAAIKTPSNSSFNSYSLYHLALTFSKSQYFLSILQNDILMSSAFSDRFFYSDFLSLAHIPLDGLDAVYVKQILVLEMEIAEEMLVSIEAAEEEFQQGKEIGTESATEHLSLEVIGRVLREIRLALPFLVHTRYTTFSNLQAVATSLFDIITNFPLIANEDLLPISVILEIAIISILLKDDSLGDDRALVLASHLSRISFLYSSSIASDIAIINSTPSSSPQHRSNLRPSNSSAISNLFNYLPSLSPFLKIYDVTSIASIFESSSLFQLELLFLTKILSNYNILRDVCEDSPGMARDIFEEQKDSALRALMDQREEEVEDKVGDREGEIGSSSTIKGINDQELEEKSIETKHEWKWESMVGTYVVSTPSTVQKSSTAIRNKRLNLTRPKVKQVEFDQSIDLFKTSPSKIIDTPSSLGFSSLGRSCDNHLRISGGMNRKEKFGTPSISKTFLNSAVAKKLWNTRKKEREFSQVESADGIEDNTEQLEEYNDPSQSPSPPFQQLSSSQQSSSSYYDRKRKIEVLDLSLVPSSDEELYLSSDEDEFAMEILENPLLPSRENELDDIDFLSNVQVEIPIDLIRRKKIKSKSKNKKVKRYSRVREVEGSDDELGM